MRRRETQKRGRRQAKLSKRNMARNRGNEDKKEKVKD